MIFLAPSLRAALLFVAPRLLFFLGPYFVPGSGLVYPFDFPCVFAAGIAARAQENHKNNLLASVEPATAGFSTSGHGIYFPSKIDRALGRRATPIPLNPS